MNKKCKICKNKFSDKPLYILKNVIDNANTQENILIDLKIYQCELCGTVQLSNKPVDYYRHTIRSNKITLKGERLRCKQFKKFSEKYNLKNKKVIEIGAGRGEYLSLAKKYMNNVSGLEKWEDSVKTAEAIGHKMIHDYFDNEDIKLTQAPYDAFYIFNFLEHIPNINQFLRGIYNNLTDDAVGIIEVPNFDMILKEQLFTEFIHDHIFYFTEDTLRYVLNLNGFEIVNVNQLFDEYVLSVEVMKKKPLQYKNTFNDAEVKFVTDINNKLSKYKSAAIYGAGHQALTILSLINKNNIRYIFDDDIYKHNRQIYNIPILRYNDEKLYNVDGLFIIAGGYTMEIAKRIISKTTMDIYILDKLNIIQTK